MRITPEMIGGARTVDECRSGPPVAARRRAPPRDRCRRLAPMERTTRRGSFAVAFAVIGVLVGSSAAAASHPPLTVAIVGNGVVSISSGESLVCLSGCRARFRPSGRVVVLSAHPGGGWSFANWAGGCAGTSPTCRVALGAARNVKAVFSPEPATSTQASGSRISVSAGSPSEFAFTLSARTLARGTVTFVVRNAGSIPHDFEVCSTPSDSLASTCDGTTTPLLGRGESASLTVTFTSPGTYEYLCTVTGHAQSGMRGFLTVT